MRKLSTFLTVIAVVIAVNVPCKVHATTFNPPGDSLVLKVFPNPTVNQIKIESLDPNLDLWNAKIVIYSSHGERVFTRQFGDGLVNLNNISRYKVSAGTYIISIINEKGEVIETKQVSKVSN